EALVPDAPAPAAWAYVSLGVCVTTGVTAGVEAGVYEGRGAAAEAETGSGSVIGRMSSGSLLRPADGATSDFCWQPAATAMAKISVASIRAKRAFIGDAFSRLTIPPAFPGRPAGKPHRPITLMN